MNDKIYIISGLLADFATSPSGVLKVVDGKVTLDETKAFNRARRVLNAGVNTFRILRRGVWLTEVPYDYKDDGYWELFRKYITILHQPCQGTPAGKGADVLVDIFDGCSEKWMYDDHAEAKRLIRAMFSHLGDLPYVKFGIGNELNHQASIEFVKEVVYPEFDRVGIFPFSYGAVYSDKDDWLEKQKGAASLYWKSDDVSFAIIKPVHGVCDRTSQNLIDTVRYWVGKPGSDNIAKRKFRTTWSDDGVKHGLSDCDWEHDTGKRRPSPAQVRSVVQYVFDALDTVEEFHTPAGERRVGFEYIGTAAGDDFCWAEVFDGISLEYRVKLGVLPENFGKYPNDWVAPQPPGPEPEPEPEPEPPTPPDESCWEKYMADRPVSKWQLGKFIKCILGL